MISGVFRKAICRSDGEHKWLWISVLMCANELRQFFGGKLFATEIQEHEMAANCTRVPPRSLQQRSVIFQRNTFDFREPL